MKTEIEEGCQAMVTRGESLGCIVDVGRSMGDCSGAQTNLGWRPWHDQQFTKRNWEIPAGMQVVVMSGEPITIYQFPESLLMRIDGFEEDDAAEDDVKNLMKENA